MRRSPVRPRQCLLNVGNKPDRICTEATLVCEGLVSRAFLSRLKDILRLGTLHENLHLRFVFRQDSPVKRQPRVLPERVGRFRLPATQQLQRRHEVPVEIT